jgi:hypothetical protein
MQLFKFLQEIKQRFIGDNKWLLVEEEKRSKITLSVITDQMEVVLITLSTEMNERFYEDFKSIEEIIPNKSSTAKENFIEVNDIKIEMGILDFLNAGSSTSINIPLKQVFFSKTEELDIELIITILNKRSAFLDKKID